VRLRWDLSLRSTWAYLCVRLDHPQAPASLFGPLQQGAPTGAGSPALPDCIMDD
jgi:hypothetical protein